MILLLDDACIALDCLQGPLRSLKEDSLTEYEIFRFADVQAFFNREEGLSKPFFNLFVVFFMLLAEELGEY